jgi:intracellular sulfur oxidation DsrE/DsrF family protein
MAMKKYRVVFHLDEPREGRSDQMFRNIENLLADLGKNNV